MQPKYVAVNLMAVTHKYISYGTACWLWRGGGALTSSNSCFVAKIKPEKEISAIMKITKLGFHIPMDYVQGGHDLEG